MKLLICTQAVDQESPTLGFFHEWIAQLAARCEQVSVICLFEGAHTLPSNVRIYSLGKERGSVSRLQYGWRFLRLICTLRHQYDTILVHMNQEYVLLGGLCWRLRGKPVYLWRNHYSGSVVTDIAAFFCTNVFCTSTFSYSAKYKKTLFMPLGINTALYQPSQKPTPNSVLFYARMAPSKRPEVLLGALEQLRQQGASFYADFYGTPAPHDEAYLAALKERAAALGGGVQFFPGKPPAESPPIFSAHEIYVDSSPSGMFNKTLFEAASCGCLVLASSRDWAALVDPRLSFKEGDETDLARKLNALLTLPESEKTLLRERLKALAEGQRVELLVSRLVEEMRPARPLILFQNGSIGDFLMSLYLAQMAHESGLFGKVSILVPRNKAFLRDVAGEYPYVRVEDTYAWRMPRRAATVVIHPTPGRIPLRVKLLAWFLTRRGGGLLGFQDRGPLCKALYTKNLAYNRERNYIDTVRSLARELGAAPGGEPPRLRFMPSGNARAARGLSKKEYVVFHPGASNPKRMFKTQDAVAVVAHIQSKHPGLRVVLSGGKGERTFIGEIQKQVPGGLEAIGLPARELAEIIAGARLFIGTDTGTTHLACFLGTPVLEVAHHGTPNWLAQYCPTAVVLYHCGDVPPAEVFAGLDSVLQ